MAIYKLGDIASINMCKRVFSRDTNSTGEIPFFKIGTLGGHPDAFISKDMYIYLKNNYKHPEKNDSLISCSGTIGKVVKYDGRPSYFQDSNIVWLESEYILKKYLYYWLLKNPFKPTQGATIKRLYNSNIKNSLIDLPTSNKQQKIIDIIEPHENLFLKYNNCVRIDTFENAKHDINQLIDIIEPIEKAIDKYRNIIEKTKIIIKHISKNASITKFKFTFEKGFLSNSIGGTPFLNVSAANGKINRYVSEPKNIFKGDITLSLDGNPGLVNFNLEGFNGYLYKVTSTLAKNYQIYFSLIHPYNQKIIKINETGTTIKHSANSKKHLKLLKFKEDNTMKFYFEILYYFENFIDKYIFIKNKIIKILIK